MTTHRDASESEVGPRTHIRRGLWVMLGISLVLSLGSILIGADARVQHAAGALLLASGAGALLVEWRERGQRHSVIVLPVVALLMAWALLGAWSVSANWPLYSGRAAHDAGELAVARARLQLAIQRMNGAGIDVPLTRYRLTAAGPVYVTRVTCMTELAAIAAEEGRWDEAIDWLREAETAGRADPGEDADFEWIADMIMQLEQRIE